MIEFVISFLLAFITGQTVMSESSSMSSDNPIPYVEVRYEWDCFPPDIDTCWVVLVDNKIVRSGP